MTDLRAFGHIPGMAPGTVFADRAALARSGLHKPHQAGISGSAKTGADSIVVSGGYEDDQDFGAEIVYTGQGGRDINTGMQIANQQLERGNLALVVSELNGFPVRVIRGCDPKNQFAPNQGYRYDGLYRIESHWHEAGKAGFSVWRYRFVMLESDYTPPIKPGKEGLPLIGKGSERPSRVLTINQRIVRDTNQAKALKALYGHTCQVCGTKLITSGGAYAEAAHIRSLGKPHNGPDTPDNLICLCPNHHVMFDFGAFSIADDFSLIGIQGVLQVHKNHNISVNHLAYHRNHYLNLHTSPSGAL